MARTNIDINITDLSGHTFTIKLNWDICIMKQEIARHYEEQYKTNFCNEKGITKMNYTQHRNICMN